MNWREEIVVDPGVCHGQPCFKGTRVLVHVILDNLAAGRSQEQITADFPSLSTQSIQAAMAYAADVANERIVTAPGSG